MDARLPLRSRHRRFLGEHPVAFLKRASLALVVVPLLISLIASPTVSAADWAPPRTVFVAETGHTLDGLFLDLWREQGELLGDPITEELRPEVGWSVTTKDGDVVQYYENAALVYLPQEAPGAQVQLLDLGRGALAEALAARPSLALQRAAERTTCAGSMDDCVGFAAAGHTLRGSFRDFAATSPGMLLGAPITESFRAADGALVQYFEHGIVRLDRAGSVQPLPLGRQAASRLKLATTPIIPPTGVPLYDESLFVPPPEAATPIVAGGAWSVGTVGPGSQQGAWKEIVVSISAQAMWAYEEGELVHSSYVSTGTAEVPQTVTPIGSWSILTKYEIQDMEGTISDEYYFVEDVPDVMYFDNLGNALHGTYWHSNFGTPMSHGCVNLPLEVADWIYAWAPIGTAVTVIA